MIDAAINKNYINNVGRFAKKARCPAFLSKKGNIILYRDIV
jgi:hypothetical protein